MACFHPIQAYQASDGSVLFSERGDIVRSLTLPCGQCWGCRLERSRQWAMRCMHEAALYDNNCFITLTYNDDHCPSDRSLNYDDFQRFMKRFRKRFKGVQEVSYKKRVYHKPVSDSVIGSSDRSFDLVETKSNPIRFYMCGEYGEKFERPHFHACIFNFNFPDKTVWKRTPSGQIIYRSKALEELWSDEKGDSIGYSSIGDVTFESAAYVARYVMKKRTGKGSEDHYETTDFETGEIKNRRPEFNKMSLKPGIGAGWFDRFSADVYPHDYVVVNGKEVRPPKYYDKKFAEISPDEFEALQLQRFVDAVDRYEDNTDQRLLVKEQVTLARTSSLKRSID